MARSRSRADDYDDAPKPPSDAYTVMLALSLAAMLIGCVFLALDWYQYPENKPPQVQDQRPAGGAPQTPSGGGQPTPERPAGT